MDRGLALNDGADGVLGEHLRPQVIEEHSRLQVDQTGLMAQNVTNAKIGLARLSKLWPMCHHLKISSTVE